MHVFQIGPRGQGGVDTVICSLIESSLEKDYQFVRIETTRGKRKLFPFVIALIKCLIIKNNSCCLAHIHMASKGSFLRKRIIIKMLHRKKIPIIIHLHGAKFREFFSLSTKRQKNNIISTFNIADKVIVLTEDWLSFADSLGVINKTVVIPNFTNVPDIITNKESQMINILFLGRVGERKGTFDLVRAFEIVIHKMGIRNVKLIIGGDGELEELRRIVRKLDIVDFVEVVGWLSERQKEEVLLYGDILVLPSYFESFGLSLVEGMSYGLPVIGTKAGSIPSVVRDNIDGLLITAGDINQLAKTIKILVNDKQLRTYIGQNGRAHVINEYSETVVCNKIRRLYEELVIG